MKTTLFVMWRQYDWQSEGDIFICTDNHSTLKDGNHKLIKEIEIDLDFAEPTRDEIAQMKVKSLQTRKSELLAKAHQEIKQIDDKIQQLSCLTFVPDAEENLRTYAETRDEA